MIKLKTCASDFIIVEVYSIDNKVDLNKRNKYIIS